MKSIGETVILDVDSKQPYKIKKLRDKIRNIIDEDDVKIPSERHMYTGEFKSIDARTMKEFQAFTTEQMGFQDYICFPVYQFGKLKFIECRLIEFVFCKETVNNLRGYIILDETNDLIFSPLIFDFA